MLRTVDLLMIDLTDNRDPAKAAAIKRAVDNDRKINQIAEGIQLAENKKKFNQLEF